MWDSHFHCRQIHFWLSFTFKQALTCHDDESRHFSPSLHLWVNAKCKAFIWRRSNQRLQCLLAPSPDWISLCDALNNSLRKWFRPTCFSCVSRSKLSLAARPETDLCHNRFPYENSNCSVGGKDLYAHAWPRTVHVTHANANERHTPPDYRRPFRRRHSYLRHCHYLSRWLCTRMC